MQLTLEKSYIAGKPVRVDDLGGQLFGGEANAHKFVITQYEAQSSAETIAITGSVSGTLMASTGATVPLTGSLEDGKAVVVLDEDCYKVPGRFVLTIFVTSGDATLCIYCGVGNVLRTSTDTVAYPTESLPNLAQLVAQVQAAIDSFPADLTAIQAAIAANYDDLTYPIIAGTYAWHAGTLYKAKTDISAAESWIAAHWETVHAANDLATDISALKSAFDVLDSRTSTGVVTYEKAQIMNDSEVVSRGTLYQNVNISYGNTDFASIPTASSSGAYALKIPIAGAKRISYPTFKSTGYFGCFMLDANDIVVWSYSEPNADTGTIRGVSVPDNANWFLLSVPTSLINLSWDVVLEYPVLNSFVTETDMRFGVTYTKAQAREAFVQYSANRLYQNNNVIIGTTKLSEIPFSTSNGAYALLIDVSNADYITYPVFKSSGYFGSFVLDSENVVIWAHDEKNADTGTLKTIQLPTGAAYMLLSISTSLASLDWMLSLIKGSLLYESGDGVGSEAVTPFADSNRNMCLAGIKTDILTNKIPFHRGFLFHKLQNDDGSLWYGSDFEHINKIGTVSFSPSLMRFAISPKDGRIIAIQRDSRNGMWVWDGTTETRLNGFSTNPMAWLYNSGVDFINDGDDEYCIFAEYNGTIVADRDLHVWRGKYPYTSPSNWEIVLTQKQQTDISHFHMVRRDPWTNILYLTAGDSSAESKWWYSTDFGATWTLLVSGSDTGWGDSTCRTINFVFTSNYVYWATDHAENEHALFRIARGTNGILDLATKEKLTDLPGNRATNSICYVESPNGLFMYDRVDTTPTSEYGKPITMQFYDFEDEQLKNVVTLGLVASTWGGSRGKCYINYTNSKQPMPAMGFSIDTPCIFDLVCDNPAKIGTIAYDVGSKTVRTIDY